jgi:hypothetical protein
MTLGDCVSLSIPNKETPQSGPIDDPLADPSSQTNNKDLLDSTTRGTTSLLTGVSIAQPEPVSLEDDTTK